MRNKKGFTLIELIVSVVLVSVVLVALIGSLLQLRSAYSVVHENSDVIVYTSSISRVINSDINANSGIKFISCETDGKKCSLILGNDERRELIITENDKILDDAEEGITHTNNKTTLKYMDTTRYDKTNNEADKILLYIRTLELDKYSNDNAQVTTSSGYNFYDMSANQYEYFDERGRYLDAFTTLTIRLLDGVNLDLSKYNITLYGAGRYDYSKYIGRAFRIDLDNNDADTAGTTTIDEVFGVGFFKAESSHTKKDQIKKITIPTKKVGNDPQVFLGYFYEPYGVNVETQIIDASGNIYADPRTFKNDVILNDSTTGRVYAKWSPTAPGFRFPPGCIENCTPEPEEYTVTLNKDQSGKTCNSVGTNSYIVKYKNMVPPVEIPQCAGYTFEGYLYNDVDLYHNRNGIGEKTYEIVGNATFDAQWHACEQGQYSLITQQVCSDCVKGSIAATSASGECTPCQNGKTTNGVKSTTCNVNCPNNNEHVLDWKPVTWNENTNELTNECVIKTCKTGYDGQTSSNRCVANSYTITFALGGGKLNGSTSPSNISATYDVDVTINNPMRAGYAFAGWTYNGTPATALAGGVAWSSTSTKSKATVFKNLTSVSGGTVTMTANWTECPAGSFNDGTSTVCSTCPTGSYSTTSRSSSCTPCPGSMTCPAGSTVKTACNITCTAGNYLKANESACRQCPAGSYCAGGTYNFNSTTDQGIESCPGSMTSAAGSSVKTQCNLTCTAGKYLKANESACRQCPANSYCAGGTYNFNSTTNQGIESCPGSMTSTAGSSAKTQCNIACSAGNYLKANESACRQCPANSYCVGGTYNFNTSTDQGIESCPGSMTSTTGSSAKTQCSISCGAGTYLAGSGSTCSTCTINHYCVGGTYNFSTNAQGISSCPSTYPYSSAGSSARTSCYKGTSCSPSDCNNTGCTAGGSYTAPSSETCTKSDANHTGCTCTGTYSTSVSHTCSKDDCNHSECTPSGTHYYCPSGYSSCSWAWNDSSRCYKTTNASASTSTSIDCPAGMVIDGSCHWTSATDGWCYCAVNPGGGGEKSNQGICSRTTTYSCSSGALSGQYCYHYSGYSSTSCTISNAADYSECSCTGTYYTSSSGTCSPSDCDHSECTVGGSYDTSTTVTCTNGDANHTGCTCTGTYYTYSPN